MKFRNVALLAALVLAAVVTAFVFPGAAHAAISCPATDNAGFPVGTGPGYQDTTTDPIFCSYPAFPGESANDFFCTYSATTGALVTDNDAGFCPSTGAGTPPPPPTYTCPPTDQLGFPVGTGPGYQDTTSNPIFCSYPAVPGENPNDFFCTYDPGTGNLVTDNDAGLCPATAPQGGPPAPTLAVTGTALSATEGQALSGITVATFTYSDTSATAGQFSASIDWGDGTTTIGSISGSSGSFSVTGSHTYAEEGSYTATVTVTAPDADSKSATDPVTVADAPLTAGPLTLASGATAGGTPETASFSFTDGNPSSTTADFTTGTGSAVINWGDGNTTNGSVSGSAGSFTVTGSHVYTSKGNNTVTVTVTDKGGSTTTKSGSVSVAATATSTSLAVTPSSPVPAGTQETLTATVTPSTATGTVQFYDGASTIGGPVTVSSGKATLTTTLALGTHTLTAKFTPMNTNVFIGSTSGNVTYVVSQAQTFLRVAASGNVPLHGSVSDTATISGGLNPTGTLTFKLYGPNPVTCTNVPAVFTTTVAVHGDGSYTSPSYTPLYAGNYYWLVTYSGDGNNLGASSACGGQGGTVTITQH